MNNYDPIPQETEAARPAAVCLRPPQHQQRNPRPGTSPALPDPPAGDPTLALAQLPGDQRARLPACPSRASP